MSNQIRVKTLKTSSQLKDLMQKYFMKLTLAKKILRKKTAWVTAGFPVEFLYLFDVFPMHPENCATIAAARRKSPEFIALAEEMGFSDILCSYMKTNIGAVQAQAPITIGGIEKPTFMASTGTICDTHVKWFEVQSHKFKVPHFVIDVPHYVNNVEDRMDDYVDYVVEQFYEYFDFAEKITGHSFDEKKWREILRLSDELCGLWQEIYELRKMVPCPVGYADTLAAIFPMVLTPGTDFGLKFYKNIVQEVKGLIKEQKGVVPEEKYRLLFEGIPFWYNIKFFHKLATEHGAVVVYEPYTYSFGPRKPINLPYDKTLRELAKIVIHFPYQYNLKTRTQYFEQIIKDYKIDGVILHNNFSCRPSCAPMYDLKANITRDTNVPVLIIDGDMNDPRMFSEEQMKTRVEAFIELMKANK